MTQTPWPNPPSGDSDIGPGRLIRKTYRNLRWLRPVLHDCNSLAQDIAADWAEEKCAKRRSELEAQYANQRNELAFDWLKLRFFDTAVHSGIIYVASETIQGAPTLTKVISENPITLVVIVAMIVIAKQFTHRK